MIKPIALTTKALVDLHIKAEKKKNTLLVIAMALNLLNPTFHIILFLKKTTKIIRNKQLL